MSIDWNTAGDFAEVVDGGQTVTLLRRGSGAEVEIATAVRSLASTSEPEPTGGTVTASDAVWEFELPAGEAPPAVGDAVIDGAGVDWTVLGVAPLRQATRLRCQTRALAICFALDQRITLQQAAWHDVGAGPEVASWRTIRTGVPARIQPIETAVDHAASPVGSTKSYRVLMVGEVDLDHNHRLIDARGTAYQVDRYTQAERIDALAVAEVSIEQSAM